ncbi:MAG: class I SAM-dependent methyltransferase [Candidatus Omnitrophica bacterium]|nr:class I SAM-dependent methyltransferase [Candidatus Omnitrophota bacterium]
MRLNPEAIFHFPSLYEHKNKMLSLLNGLGRFRVNDRTRGKRVLDIGCGPVQLYYDPGQTRQHAAVDNSPEMVEVCKRRYPSSRCLVASAEALPFEDKAFDIVTLFFVLHHIDFKKWAAVLAETQRVSKEKILVLDHIRHDGWLRGNLQQNYWNLFDGGKAYLRKKEWASTLKGFRVPQFQRKGVFFGNVCYFEIEPREC